MLGFFTAIYSGLTLVFACIGVAFVAYKLYQRYFKRGANNAPPNQEFENIRRERQQREEAVSQHVTQSNLFLHHNANQVVDRFKAQQAHLEKYITDFDKVIEQSQRTNSGLNETNSSLQNSVIKPMQALLSRIKAHFQEANSLISNLSTAMTNATKSLAEREKEVQTIIENLAASQANFSSIMEQMPKVNLNAQYVAKLEKRNRDLEQFQSEATPLLTDLTRKCKKLIDIKNRQQRIIELLQAQNQGEATSHDSRLFGARSPNTSMPIDCIDELDPRDISTELRTDTALVV